MKLTDGKMGGKKYKLKLITRPMVPKLCATTQQNSNYFPNVPHKLTILI